MTVPATQSTCAIPSSGCRFVLAFPQRDHVPLVRLRTSLQSVPVDALDRCLSVAPNDLKPLVSGLAEAQPGPSKAVAQVIRTPFLDSLLKLGRREEERGWRARQAACRPARFPVRGADGTAVPHVVSEVMMERVHHLPVSRHVPDPQRRGGRKGPALANG